MDSQELRNFGVLPWDEVEPEFNGQQLDALFGNGLSMSFSSDFGYNSLFEIFVNGSGNDLVPVLSQFNTTNFEEIMLRLRHTNEVNKLFNKDYPEIDEAIECLKEGLITAVREVHPAKASLDIARLASLTSFIGRFGNVFTTNYDSIIYYLILAHNDLCRDNQFSDYFFGDMGANPRKHFVDYQDLNKYSKRVYYLHGALFIFRGSTVEYKRTTSRSGDLLNAITEEIGLGEMPLFISEGSANEKRKAISQSGYLSFCLHQLRMSANHIFVYGLSLESQDRHLLEAIIGPSKKIIFAVYTNGSSIKERIELQLAKLKNDIVELGGSVDNIRFIDSNSII